MKQISFFKLDSFYLFVFVSVATALSGCTGSSNKAPSVLPPTAPASGSPETPEERRNRILGRNVDAFFGANRPEPAALSALPNRRPFQRRQSISRPENPDVYFQNMAECRDRYEQSWSGNRASNLVGTRQILARLRQGQADPNLNCWDGEQQAEILRIEAEIVHDLDELRNRTASNQLRLIRSTGLNRLEAFNLETRTILNRLGRNYQEIQEDLSQCRIKQITRSNDVRPVPADADPAVTSEDKAVLHVVGDIFGEKSGLEGQNYQESQVLLERRIAVFRSMRLLFQSQQFIASPQQAEPCQGILGGYQPEEEDRGVPFVDFRVSQLQDMIEHGEQALRLSADFLVSIENFNQSFLRELARLVRRGDWFYFMGGNIDHAVLYQVQKEEGDTFSFRVYNSGSGANFHMNYSDGTNERVYPFEERRGISRSKLTRIAFLKALRDLKFQTETTSIGMNTLYKNILRELGGRPTATVIHPEDFLDPQVAGNCSYFVLPYMQTSLLRNPSLGAHLEFFVKSKILEVYMKTNALRFHQQNPIHLLGQKLVSFYTEEIARNLSENPGSKGRYLDFGIARESRDRILEYRRLLDESVRSRETTRTENAPRFSSNDWRNLAQRLFNGVHLDFLNPIGRILRTLTPLQSLDLENWNPSSASLNQDLGLFISQMIPTSELGSEDGVREIERALKGTQEIAKRIPLDSAFFNSFTPEQLVTFLGHLNDLSQYHFWALLNSRKTSAYRTLGLSPETLLSQVKIMSLADQAIRIYGSRGNSRNGFQSFSNLYNPLLKIFLFDRSVDQWTSLLMIEDQTWADDFNRLVTYWRGRQNQDRLFMWERLPIFATEDSAFERHLYKRQSEMDDSHWSQPFGDPSQSSWSDIRWASHYLQTATGVSPQMPQVLESLSFLPGNGSQAGLPLPFFEIRDISFITHYFLGGSFNSRILNSTQLDIRTRTGGNYFSLPHLQRVSVPISFAYVREVPPLRGERPLNHYRNTYRIFQISLIADSSVLSHANSRLRSIYSGHLYVGDPNFGLELSGERESLGPWRRIIENRSNYQPVLNSELNIPIPYYRRLSSPDNISFPQVLHSVPLRSDPSRNREVPVTSLEMQRQLLNLDSPLITLAYFREHPHLLREKRWQVFFKAIVFQPNLLIKEYRRTPTLPRLLSDFCWSNFERRVEDEDYLNAGFFLRMHQLLEEFTVSQSQVRAQWPENRIARAGFKRLLDLTPEISDRRNLILRDLMRTYLYQNFDNLTPSPATIEDLSLFLMAAIYRDRNSIQDPANFEADEENAVFGIYSHKRRALESFIRRASQPEINSFFSQLIRYFGHAENNLIWRNVRPAGVQNIPLANNPAWEGQSGSAEQNTIRVDLSRPLIFIGENEERPLPGIITSDPLFKKIIQLRPDQRYATWLGGQRYEFIDRDQRYVRVDASGSSFATIHNRSSLVIEKKWGENWYQLLADDYVNRSAISLGNWTVFPGYHNWQLVRSYLMPTDLRRSPPAYRLEENHNWREWNQIDYGTEILTFDPQDQKLFAVSRFGYETSPIIQKVKHEGGQAWIYGTTLYPVISRPGERNTPLSFLKRIELPRMIWAWKNRDQQIEQIEFPRFGIRFIPHGDHLISPELENYALSQTQTMPEQSEKLGNFSNFILLEKEGKQRVIVPRFQFKPSGTTLGGLFVEYNLEWNDRSAEEKLRKPEPLYAYGRNSQRLFVWSIDPFDFQLKLPEAEDRFYLAMVHLWGRSSEYHSYDRARELLYGSRSELGDYRAHPTHQVVSGAREVLEWIVKIDNKDFDPRGIALKLGAGFSIVENDLANHRYQNLDISGRVRSFPEFYSASHAILSKLYSKYLDVRERISTRWLPEDLEKIYLKIRRIAFPADSMRENARWADLRGENNLTTLPRRNTLESIAVNFERFESPDSFTSAFDNGRMCSRNDNLFLGMGINFEVLYQISLSSDRISSNRAEFIRVLSRLLGVQQSTLASASDATLREEYLTYLRFFIRQVDDANSCKSAAEFLYAVAACTGDRSFLRTHSERQIEELLHYRGESDSQAWSQRYQYVRNSLQSTGLGSINREPISRSRDEITETWSPNVAVPAGASGPNARPARFWDPRNPSTQRGFHYRYQRDLRTEDARYDLQTIPVIPRDRIENYLHERNLNEAERSEISRISSEIEAIFNPRPRQSLLHEDHPDFDRFILGRLDSIREMIRSKAQVDLGREQDSGKKGYEWAGSGANSTSRATLIAGLTQERANLQAQSATLLAQVRSLAAQIETEIRSVPPETWARVREVIYQESQVEVRPSLSLVLHAYATGAFGKIFQLNPSLNHERATQLLHHVTTYLLRSTYYFQMLETIRGLDQFIRNPGQEEMQRLYQTATAVRNYDVSQHPEYLVFEHTMRILIRKDQIENLELMTGDRTTLLEMIMGAGKTSVLVPLASRKNAISNQRLSIVVLPEALLPSMVKQLNSQLEQVFGKGVDRLTVQRKDKYNLEKLQHLYSRLRNDLETERVVVTSNSSIQSLFLIFIEALSDLENLNERETSARMQEVAAIQDIFQLFRNYGYVLLDEVDSLLDIMASHRFSVGHRGRIEHTIVNATTGLYRLLAEDQQIRRDVKIPFLMEEVPGARPFSKDTYREFVKERLIRLICRRESGPIFFDSPDMVRRFQRLNMEEMIRYFHSESASETESYIRRLPHDSIRDVLTVLFTQIHQTLPLSLNKAYLVHYGLCPADSDVSGSNQNMQVVCHPFIGIPYHSGSPVITSRFGTDLESLNYTIQSHLEKRDVFEMFKLEIEKLQTHFRRNRSQAVREKFASYFDQELSDGRILNLSEAEIRARSRIVSTRPRLVLELVKIYAAPKIEVFPNQLFTNSYIYPVIFRKIQGMTGTLWNYESFPAFYQQLVQSDSTARTLTALWKSPHTRQVQVIDTPAPGQSANEILETMLRGRGALSLIDQGGIFRGIENQSVVEALYTLPREPGRSYRELGIPQFIFYDSSHQIQMMRQDGTAQTVRPYVISETNRAETGAYWDMQHTTGSDLKVHPETVALLTLSKHSIMRDLLQSAWRLRDLEKNQSVILVVPRDDLKVMSKVLTDVYGSEYQIQENANQVSLETILLYLQTHEAIKVGEVNYRSVKASQRAVIVETVFDTLVNRNALGEDLIAGFHRVKSFFSNPRGDHPYERYGVPVVRTGAFQFLRREIQRIVEPLQRLFANFARLSQQFEEMLRSRSDQLPRNVTIPARSSIESDEEIEIESENEQEQEAEQETEREFERFNLDPEYRKAVIPWDQLRFFSGELFRHPTLASQLPTTRMPLAEIERLSPIMSMRDILQRGGFERYSDLFDVALSGSLNLFPIFQSTDIDHDRVFVPFGPYQGLIDHVLVVVNSNLSIRSMTLITRDEALAVLGEWLPRGQMIDGRKAFIYQFGNGLIRATNDFLNSRDSEDSIDERFQQIERNPRFQTLLMQAKFLSGRINYTDSESEVLESWIQRSRRAHQFFEFFQTTILSTKETTREEFEDSVIYHVLRGTRRGERNVE